MKVQAELGWNIINSKFYQGKEKRTKIALANELDRLQIKKRQTADIYEKAADELTEQYNFYIGTVIAHRLDNLDIMNEAYQFMLDILLEHVGKIVFINEKRLCHRVQ